MKRHGSRSPIHAHHWRIAEVNGTTSPGFCLTCGAERIFKNWSIDWEITAGGQVDTLAGRAAVASRGGGRSGRALVGDDRRS
ncbi:MAG: hypothetical protein C0506_10620 [Anaerolinea sp.]|nr:hypothetical protein [Anaerolinea sp.]